MGQADLAGITVLVTRPEHQAEPFCQLVEAAGGAVIRYPVIEIRPILLEASLQGRLKQPSDNLIFISANAVRLGIPLLQEKAPVQLEQSRLIAIGQATASKMKDMGYVPQLIPPSPYNSEALLGMPEMQSIEGESFTFVKGRGGRTFLMEQLRQYGAEVIEVDTYVRVKSRASNLMIQRFMESEKPVVAVTSVKGLHYLFELANKTQQQWLKDRVNFLVPGSRVADAVRDMHVKHKPCIAHDATDAVMFERLLKNTE